MVLPATAHPDYDRYNREERYICAHLFRLLHEPVGDYLALRRFIGDTSKVVGFRIFVEVALIRDAYHERRSNPSEFMDALVRIVADQENIRAYRTYSQLPVDLCTPHLTHPRQIREKGAKCLTKDEMRVYGSVQGMFNAKPDLVVCVGHKLFVYEAKLTLGFDNEQFMRTKHIAEIWAKLLHHDLGFECMPAVQVRTLGLAKCKPDISWEFVKQTAEKVYPADDRSRCALAQAVALGEANYGV